MNAENILSAARFAADLLLELVPHEQAAVLLSEAAVKRANAAADLAEEVKFGGGGSPESTKP